MLEKTIDRTFYEIKDNECFVHMHDGRTIKGKINISPRGRLSDVFTKEQAPFVVVHQATIDDGPRNRIFILNKSGISWVEPEDSAKTKDS